MTSTILHCVGSAILTSLASVLTVDEYTTFCVFGDGNFIMRMFDLATLNKHARRIMIFLLNHSEYSMIKQTQEQWFGSEYGASNASDGLPFPNFQTLAQSHGFNYHRLDWCNFAMSSKNLEELNQKISFVEVLINPNARVVPQSRFGSPIDVMEPPLG